MSSVSFYLLLITASLTLCKMIITDQQKQSNRMQSGASGQFIAYTLFFATLFFLFYFQDIETIGEV